MAGIRVTVTLTRRQAEAVLVSELHRGHGVRRSADVLEAERRLKTAITEALGAETPEETP